MNKLNIKDILIIVLTILSVVLLLAFIFKPNKTVITNQAIIDSLNIENRNLIIINDSISTTDRRLLLLYTVGVGNDYTAVLDCL